MCDRKKISDILGKVKPSMSFGTFDDKQFIAVVGSNGAGQPKMVFIPQTDFLADAKGIIRGLELFPDGDKR